MPPEEENKIEDMDSKEGLANALHKKGVLPSLKSYQGDVASFIQEKNQSFIDIALKNKEKEEEVKEKEKVVTSENDNSRKSSLKIKLPTGLMSVVLSVFLLLGGVVISVYAFYFQGLNPPVTELKEDSIVRADQSTIIDSDSFNINSFRDALSSAKAGIAENQVLEIKIISPITKKIVGSKVFLKKLGLAVPTSLERSIEDEFMTGIYGDESKSFFLIIKETDYGIAFRDMLEWEPKMFEEFGTFLPGLEEATTTKSAFKDMIFSNKDTRSIINDEEKVVLLYAFLDKNTILITESEAALKAIVDSYLVKSFVR